MSLRDASRIEPAAEVVAAARTWLDPVRRALGNEFLGCYLTGSVLRTGFDPAHSGVNLLVLVRSLGLGALDALAVAIPAPGRKGPRFDPLVLSEAQMRASLDAFPIEWIEIQEAHLLLEGHDVLADLDVPRTGLRLQCEHELRTKLLTLRHAYLQARGKDAAMLEPVLKAAASSFATLFRTLLRLRGEVPPAETPRVVEMVADLYRLDARALIAAYQVRFARKSLDRAELVDLYRRFLVEIDRLVDAIDTLRVP
jgi:hypothetical protein